jgi:hypothetical protein
MGQPPQIFRIRLGVVKNCAGNKREIKSSSQAQPGDAMPGSFFAQFPGSGVIKTKNQEARIDGQAEKFP